MGGERVKSSMIAKMIKELHLEEVGGGIYSVIDATERTADYDTKVGLYDALIGNPLYNRIIWGNWPKEYDRFCREALADTPKGVVLDAGCGSLVFTADAYADADNSFIVLLDRSIEMLKKGQERLRERMGTLPDNIVFVQGNIFDLPFLDGIFDTVMCQGLLHMFDEKAALLTELKRVKKPQGKLFFTSLVSNNRLGKAYLAQLQKAGEVSSIYTSESLNSELAGILSEYKMNSIGNMAYVVSK